MPHSSAVSRHRRSPESIHGRGHLRVADARQKTICQSVGKSACGLQMMVLEVGRRNFDPEVTLAILPGTEVAQQRKQRADLTAFVAEVDSLREQAAALHS